MFRLLLLALTLLLAPMQTHVAAAAPCAMAGMDAPAPDRQCGMDCPMHAVAVLPAPAVQADPRVMRLLAFGAGPSVADLGWRAAGPGEPPRA